MQWKTVHQWKDNKLLVHVTTWMNLTDVMLNKRSQTSKRACCRMPFTWSSKTTNMPLSWWKWINSLWKEGFSRNEHEATFEGDRNVSSLVLGQNLLNCAMKSSVLLCTNDISVHLKNNSLICSVFRFLTASFWASQDAVTICTLGIGTAFGESILDNTPRHATIVTRESSELLRIEQKDFKALWEVSPMAVCWLMHLRKRKGAAPRMTALQPGPSVFRAELGNGI